MKLLVSNVDSHRSFIDSSPNLSPTPFSYYVYPRNSYSPCQLFLPTHPLLHRLPRNLNRVGPGVSHWLSPSALRPRALLALSPIPTIPVVNIIPLFRYTPLLIHIPYRLLPSHSFLYSRRTANVSARDEPLHD